MAKNVIKPMVFIQKPKVTQTQTKINTAPKTGGCSTCNKNRK
jgi:hypothetical protein